MPDQVDLSAKFRDQGIHVRDVVEEVIEPTRPNVFTPAVSAMVRRHDVSVQMRRDRVPGSPLLEVPMEDEDRRTGIAQAPGTDAELKSPVAGSKRVLSHPYPWQSHASRTPVLRFPESLWLNLRLARDVACGCV